MVKLSDNTFTALEGCASEWLASEDELGGHVCFPLRDGAVLAKGVLQAIPELRVLRRLAKAAAKVVVAGEDAIDELHDVLNEWGKL